MNSINHIGIIMDGNRRWAKANGLSSHKGHDKGADTFVNACEWCIRGEIQYMTVYAFSTENWKRTQVEVAHIFGLLEKFFTVNIEKCIKEGIRVRTIGDRTRFDKKTIAIIDKVESQTSQSDRLNVQIALSYGGRDEITRAVRSLASDVSQNKMKITDITEDVFSSYLDTSGIPDVDLVIRTGGIENRRLSNFLPWQTVYSELYFSDFMWPEFTHDEFKKAIDYYNTVTRKQGK
jgi:undecaprenyl diphosphate synthase